LLETVNIGFNSLKLKRKQIVKIYRNKAQNVKTFAEDQLKKIIKALRPLFYLRQIRRELVEDQVCDLSAPD